jgi:hypothetical protein
MGLPAGQRRNNIFLHSFKGGPAGGGFSTVEDLLKFSLALQNHVFLDAGHTHILMEGKAQVGPNPDVKYAYGFEDALIYGERVVGHGGGFQGINSKLDIYPNSGYTVAVMSNYDPGAAEGVASYICKLLTGTPQVQAVQISERALQPILGVYKAVQARIPDLGLRIQKQDSHILLSLLPAFGQLEILPLDENTFFDEETTDERFIVLHDAQGGVTGLEMHLGRDVMKFDKVEETDSQVPSP